MKYRQNILTIYPRLKTINIENSVTISSLRLFLNNYEAIIAVNCPVFPIVFFSPDYLGNYNENQIKLLRRYARLEICLRKGGKKKMKIRARFLVEKSVITDRKTNTRSSHNV